MIERLWRGLFRAVEILLAIVAAAIFIAVTYAVTARYVFNASVAWADELPTLLLIWMTFVGAALLCHTDGNLRFDGLSASMPPAIQRLFEAINCVLILVFLGYLTWMGFRLAAMTWSRGVITLPLSMGVVRAVVPAAGLLMIGVYVIRLWRAIRGLPQTGEDKL